MVSLTLNLALLAHLLGDYVLQSHEMATRKTSSWTWALIHAGFYSIPFVALLAAFAEPWRAVVALVIIGGTHALIDRYRIAAYWCRWWGVGFPGLWSDAATFKEPPPFLGVWLLILVDNSMHLCINAAAIAWAVIGA
jgi:hypothetical protein